MRRRDYIRLFGASSAAFIAGCGSGNYDTTEVQTTTGDRLQENTIEITNSEFILGDSVTAAQEEKIPWGIVDVETTTERSRGEVQLEIRFYDAEDTLLESRSGRAFVHYMPAETTWRYYQRYPTETPERVEYIESRIIKNSSLRDVSRIDSTIMNSDLVVEPESGVDFAAEVDIGDTNLEQTIAVGLFYDKSERLRGTIQDFHRNPSQSLAVSSSRLIRTPPNLQDAQISDFDVVVFSGFPSTN